ncbi:MAG: hypothetical protein GX936_08185 [Clostridiales bacterium]|nr:hypothetical protein [Clostridiales bacterium]
MEIEIGKMKVSGAALLALAAAFFFDSGGTLILALFAAAVHEAGHYGALKLFRGRIRELKLELLGFRMFSDSPMSYRAEIITAAAGPAASLILAVAAAFAGRYLYCQQCYVLSGISLMFCFLNTLPSLPLDGGKVVYAVTASSFGLDMAERITCILSCVVTLALLSTGMMLLLKTGYNFTLLLAALWLLLCYCKRSGIVIKSK